MVPRGEEEPEPSKETVWPFTEETTNEEVGAWSGVMAQYEGFDDMEMAVPAVFVDKVIGVTELLLLLHT